MNWEEIREEYETTTITLKALAEKHGAKLGTLKSRKSREGWERDATEGKDATKVATMKPVAAKSKIREEPVFVEAEGLTDKQRLFCVYYVKTFNATQSAINAGYSADTAHVQGSRLLSNVKVKDEVVRLKAEMHQGIFVDAMDVLNKYIKIAFADITDFIKFTDVESTIEETEKEFDDKGRLIKETTKQVPYTYTAFRMNKSDQVDGTLLSELSRGKDGMFKLKLVEKMKALEKLEQYFDLLPESQKRKLQEEKLKADTEFAKARAELIKGTKKDTTLLEALIAAKGGDS
ncbi:terminase small subunit [Bacillus sp. C1-1]|nr:terminase small subunit [Bacillus sp. C1-1]